MSSQSLSDLAALITEHSVHTVELVTIDTYGHPRGKRVPAERFVSTVAEHGAHIADAIYVMDVQCEIVDSPLINMGTGFLDMHLEPDLSTFRLLAHRPGYATVMTNATDHRHQPHPLDPRNVLQAQIDRVTKIGYDPIVATELECYICNDDWTPAQANVQYSSLIDNFALERCAAEMRSALLDLDIPIESSNPEYGPGQLEINFAYGEPMRTADNTVLFKATVREIARSHGLRATFMAMPYTGQSGNGMHVHTSLNQDGRNVFEVGDGHLLNDVFRYWVGGLVNHAMAISLLGSPFGNGYKRVRPDSFCPTHVHWGGDNRSVLCRCTVGQGEANRVEYRGAGADANPYLIIAALLAAGADGLERELDPGAEAIGDQYSEPGKHPALPVTYAEGIAAFAGSELAAALGKDFGVNFLAMVNNELSLYEANATGGPDEVSEWEFARYVEFS
ncbi:MAG: glutamine synthetase family protein [Acidimicrobiales bacterium]